MTEEQIKEILNSNDYMECVKKLAKIYPNGFGINKIDERIKNKLKELTNKDYSIQNPIQLRKKKLNK